MKYNAWIVIEVIDESDDDDEGGTGMAKDVPEDLYELIRMYRSDDPVDFVESIDVFSGPPFMNKADKSELLWAIARTEQELRDEIKEREHVRNI